MTAPNTNNDGDHVADQVAEHRPSYGLRAIMFDLCFTGFTFLTAFWISIRCLIFGNRYLTPDLTRYSKTVTGMLAAIIKVRVEVRGLEHLPNDRPVILASKHMSWLDPIMSLQYAPSVRGLAKKELFLIPLVGRVLRLMENISVDREAGKTSVGLENLASNINASDRPLMIYPEGTRVAVGQTRAMKSGVFFIQEAATVDVLPIRTNSGCHWRGVGAKSAPGTIIYEILPPLSQGLEKNAFMAALNETIGDAIPAMPPKTAS